MEELFSGEGKIYKNVLVKKQKNRDSFRNTDSKEVQAITRNQLHNIDLQSTIQMLFTNETF